MSLDRVLIKQVPSLQQATGSHQDVEYEIGALASRHGLSLVEARRIVERCGDDLNCIDAEAKKFRTTMAL